jgi:hypothetical protein
MKCVKHIFPADIVEIKRVSNEQAERLVAMHGGGYWNFCPKSEWKALRVAPVVAIVHTDDQKREIQRKADKRKHSADKRSYRKS